MLERSRRVSLDRMVALAETARVEKEPWAQDFIRTVALTEDSALEQSLVEVLRPLAVEEVLKNIPFGRPSDAEQATLVSVNPLLLGLLEDREPLVLPLHSLNQHMFVAGGTGTGKTNLLYGISLQVMRHCSVWIIDRDKQDYRHLLRLNSSLLVFDAQSFPFNPLEVPEGVDPRHHLASFVTIFAKSNALLDGSEAMALRALYELYDERGIFEGSTNYPTLADFRAKVASFKIPRWSREAGYRDSILNRLNSYLIACPDTYNFQTGFSLSELAAKSFVLEIKGLSERHARCLVNWLLSALFQWRIANNESGNLLRNLIVVDECKYLVPPGYNQNIGFSPLASILAQCREVGMGMVFADQTAQLEDAVFVQTRTKLCMRLGSGEDIKKIQRTFGLDSEQAGYISMLDVGQAVVPEC